MVRHRRAQIGILTAIIVGAALLSTALYIWYVLFSDIGYQPPESLPVIDSQQEHRVFVYGTLRLKIVRWLVIGEHPPPQAALLPGYRRDGLNIVAAPDAMLEGKVLTVSTDQLRQLDRYERLGVRYRRISKLLADGSTAWVYQRQRCIDPLAHQNGLSGTRQSFSRGDPDTVCAG